MSHTNSDTAPLIFSPGFSATASQKVVIILGHPNENSFNADIAEAARLGATDAQAEVQMVQLGALSFDPVLRSAEQPLEPDLERARQLIESADHVVWVFPVWWAAAPALLKGFIDRVFLKGWAFRYEEGNVMQIQLLKGRSSRVICTMDSPSWWYRLVYRRAAHRAFITGTLKYCGFGPVTESTLFKTRELESSARQKWLEKVRQEVKKDVSLSPKAIEHKRRVKLAG